jgi:ABC-type Fe3+/spermidine/putrescine transport system ATPase subunit
MRIGTAIGTAIGTDAATGPVTLVIRPEDIQLRRAGSRQAPGNSVDNVFDGRVIGRFYLGAMTHYDIETSVGRLRCQSAEAGIELDERVDVHIPADKVVALAG